MTNGIVCPRVRMFRTPRGWMLQYHLCGREDVPATVVISSGGCCSPSPDLGLLAMEILSVARP